MELESVKKALEDAITRNMSAEVIGPKIEAVVVKAIDDALGNLFCYRSPLKNQLEATIQSLVHVPNVDDMACLGHSVGNMLKARLAAYANDSAEKVLATALDGILEPKATISLAELKELYSDYLKDSDTERETDGYEYDPEFSWMLDNRSSGFYYLSFGPEESKYSDKNWRMQLREEEPGAPMEAFAVHAPGRNDLGDFFVGPIHGFTAAIFRIATKFTKVTK